MKLFLLLAVSQLLDVEASILDINNKDTPRLIKHNQRRKLLETTSRKDFIGNIQSEGGEGPVGYYDGNMMFCRPGQYAKGFKVWNHAPAGSGDDTGMEWITLKCSSSGEILWDPSRDWLETQVIECAGDGLLKGFRTKTGEDGSSDNVGTIDVEGSCDNNDNKISTSGLSLFSGGNWGIYGTCPTGSAVCGIIQKYHFPQALLGGDQSDNNGIKLACCAIKYDGCRVISYVIDDESDFKKGIMTADSIQPIVYRNTGSQDSSVSTLGVKTCQTQETTFTHTSGSELNYGFKVGFKYTITTEVGVQIKVIQASATQSLEISGEYNMDWKYYNEYSNSKTESSEICVEKPSEDFKCPGRTICKREFITIKKAQSEFPMTITSICDNGRTFITKGKISTKGYVGIDAVDTQFPMDCVHYTDDYFSRGEGKLFACDTCNADGDKTNKCDICRDGYILLDNQCIDDNTCVNLCGGEIKGSGINPNGIGDNNTPWSGGYCNILDENKYNSLECGNKYGRKPNEKLLYRISQDYDEIWNDAGSGAWKDISIWKPKIDLNAGESFITFIPNENSHDKADINSYIITNVPDYALTQPSDYTAIWDSTDTGSDLNSYWFKPIPPTNYVCFGNFFTNKINADKKPISAEGYKCVHNNWVNEVTINVDDDIEKIWSDWLSGSSVDAQIWEINVNEIPYKYYGASNDGVINGPYYTLKTEAKPL